MNDRAVLERHPQRDAIIGMLLDHKTPKQVIKALSLTVTERTVFRFKKWVLSRAFESNLTTLQSLTARPNNKATSIHREEVLNGVIENVALDREAFLPGRVETLLNKRLSRRDRWFKDAEKRILLDAQGQKHEVMDHSALAKHDANEARDLELMARIDKVVTDDKPGTNVNLVVYIPPSPR